MFCGKCGAQLKDGAAFCNLCGTPVTKAESEAVPPGGTLDDTAVLPPMVSGGVAADAGETAVLPATEEVSPPAWATHAPGPPQWATQGSSQPAEGPRGRSKAGLVVAGVLVGVLLLAGGAFAAWKLGVFETETKTASSADKGKTGADDTKGAASGETTGAAAATETAGGEDADQPGTGVPSQPGEPEPTDSTGEEATPPERDLSSAASMSSSSHLPSSRGVSYGPENLVDDRGDTCWAEDAGGYGVGEYAEFSFSRPVTVTRIDVLPGYDKFNEVDRWYSNGRVKKARVEFSDGSSEEVRFADEKTVQSEAFKAPHETTYVRFVIVSAYEAEGNRAAKDTSIGTMRVFGY